MKGRFTLGALAAIAGMFLLYAPTAFGAPVTKTLTFPLSGNSSTNIFNLPFSCCRLDFDAGPISVHDDIHGGMSLDLATSMKAPTHNDLTFTDTNLRQGSHLDLTNTFTKDPGSFNVNYTLSGNLSLYGFAFSYSKSAGDTMSCGLPLLTDACAHTTNVNLFSFNLIDIGVAYFQINVLAPITTTANITGDGVTSHRTLTVAGTDALPPTNLTFTSSPQVKDEGVNLSCSLPANQPVNYAMGNESSHVNGNVTEGVGIGVSGSVFIRDPIFGDHDIFDTPAITIPNLFSLPSVGFNPINLAAPGQNVDLGNLLPNTIAPTVAMDTIPTNGTEGNPIQLSVKGTGPGGSLSPCGDSSLDIKWSFDDGGTASGKTVTHVFAENYLGGVPHTGQVVVTDPTGLQTTLHFSVPVADAPLVASCATPPVSLQSFNGTVASLIDGNPSAPTSDFTATIAWGDGSSSTGTVTGSGGSYSVSGSHAYGSTGFFNVSAAIKDVGGSSATTPPCQMLVFAFAPGSGSFVIGDKNSADGTAVTFWGAQWGKLNSLSGGDAPASFKGFAGNPSTPTCGTGWSAGPGNSTPPPAGQLPAFMGVIVSSSVSKSAAQISGDTPHIVVVKTNPGYAPNPGHAGTGTVVSQAC
jgi:PKD domain-containing protein